MSVGQLALQGGGIEHPACILRSKGDRWGDLVAIREMGGRLTQRKAIEAVQRGNAPHAYENPEQPSSIRVPMWVAGVFAVYRGADGRPAMWGEALGYLRDAGPEVHAAFVALVRLDIGAAKDFIQRVKLAALAQQPHLLDVLQRAPFPLPELPGVAPARRQEGPLRAPEGAAGGKVAPEGLSAPGEPSPGRR